MKKRLTLAFVLLLAAIGANTTFAQTTDAAALARQLELQLLAGAGVQMKFDLAGQGKISVTADLKDRRIRLESPTILIISDGSTIWTNDKSANRVTIDNISQTGSPFKDPAALFKFSEHYSARLVSQSGTTETIELTPDKQLQSLLQSSGSFRTLVLSVKPKGKKLTITKATVSSSRGTSQTNAIAIASLRSIKSSDFVFKLKPGMKTVDLRE